MPFTEIGLLFLFGLFREIGDGKTIYAFPLDLFEIYELLDIYVLTSKEKSEMEK